MRVAVGLVHYPIRDRAKNIVATNVTNLDIHDIARACRVYGVERYYIIHPMPEQLSFVSGVLEHWRIGQGAKYNPMRRTSLTMVHTASSVEAAVADWGGKPEVIATHARAIEGVRSETFKSLSERLQRPVREPSAPAELNPENDQILLLFGTGFGLTEEFMRGCDAILEPIKGASKDDYRHLSVRSAVSICLDRLLGSW